jgi:hypothetical protein|tara:strand:+ start:317 stop:445 length:129 start_codon:yes stop_codon:yes gene_type:complete
MVLGWLVVIVNFFFCLDPRSASCDVPFIKVDLAITIGIKFTK